MQHLRRYSPRWDGSVLRPAFLSFGVVYDREAQGEEPNTWPRSQTRQESAGDKAAVMVVGQPGRRTFDEAYTRRL
jgi:hypothetical protein